MKKLFILLSLIISMRFNAFSQNNAENVMEVDSIAVVTVTEDVAAVESSAPLSADWYKTTKEWKKYKLYRNLGWTFFGVGVPLTFGCYFGFFIAAWNNASPWGTGALMAGSLVGAVMTVSSIPIITLAYINRYKAKKSRVDLGISYFNLPSLKPHDTNIPALNFCLTF